MTASGGCRCRKAARVGLSPCRACLRNLTESEDARARSRGCCHLPRPRRREERSPDTPATPPSPHSQASRPRRPPRQRRNSPTPSPRPPPHRPPGLARRPTPARSVARPLHRRHVGAGPDARDAGPANGHLPGRRYYSTTNQIQ